MNVKYCTPSMHATWSRCVTEGRSLTQSTGYGAFSRRLPLASGKHGEHDFCTTRSP
jgi:hypothetical protein